MFRLMRPTGLLRGTPSSYGLLSSSRILQQRSIHYTVARLCPSKDPFKELETSPQRPIEVEPVKKEHQSSKHSARANAIVARLPKRLQKYGERLVNAPVAHLTSFVILHEFSAIVPLFGLWYAFHHWGFLPADIPSWMLLKGSEVVEKILGETVADMSIQERTRLVLEGATAYGIVKATFPLRVMFSIFLTPWFARVFVVPGLSGLQKLFALIRGTK